MADITNVNLLFLRKARGIAPLSRYTMQDDGSLLVAAPDEMEVRTFHLVKFVESGRSQICETYSVETLRRTEVLPDGSAFVGTTDDDLYLFRQARKSRFLPDRRASYTDVSLGAVGGRFVAAFSDLLGSGHSVAFGDIAGRVLWTKDISFPISRVCVDREAKHTVVAGETGELLMLDSSRVTLWSHRQEVPLLAVATTGPERTVFATGGPGVETGGVGMVGSDGSLLWFTELLGTPLDVGLDATGKMVAVLLQLDATTGRLVFLSSDGMPTWDIDYDESRPTGLSVSPSGRFVAVSQRDGGLNVYELTYGNRLASLSEESALSEARTAWDQGNVGAAADLLRGRLALVPSDTRACALLAEVLADLKRRAISAAENAEAVSDFASADLRLAEAGSELPFDAELPERRRALRARWHEAKLSAGEAALSRGESDLAEAEFLQAIEADGLSTIARERLADSRYAAAAAALHRGRQLLAISDATAALVAFTEARQKGASGPELTELVRTAQVRESLALGTALYQDRQYAAALFQYKKALRLDPENGEALQKISYAQNFLQDTQLSDRFSRLE